LRETSNQGISASKVVSQGSFTVHRRLSSERLTTEQAEETEKTEEGVAHLIHCDLEREGLKVTSLIPGVLRTKKK
jgi:hypothetical protein